MKNALRKIWSVIDFLFFFIRELVLSNIRVAQDVLRPLHRLRPGVVAVPLDVRTDTEITMVSNLITVTPGNLSLDVSADRTVLYVHAMRVEDLDKLRRDLKRGFERRVMEVTR